MSVTSDAPGKPPRVSAKDVDRTRQDLARAQADAEEKRRSLDALHTRLELIERELCGLQRREELLSLLLRVRLFLDNSMTRLGGILNLLLVSAAIVFVISSALGVPVILRIVAATLAAVCSGLERVMNLSPVVDVV
jgi:hypothetical protein